MLLNEGDKVLVANRRLFERDEPRFFVGRVVAYEAGVIKAAGRSYVRDMMSGRMLEKPEDRVRILALASGALIVYQLPEAADLGSVGFTSEDGRLELTDGQGFAMNLAEFAHRGRV